MDISRFISIAIDVFIVIVVISAFKKRIPKDKNAFSFIKEAIDIEKKNKHLSMDANIDEETRQEIIQQDIDKLARKVKSEFKPDDDNRYEVKHNDKYDNTWESDYIMPDKKSSKNRKNPFEM